MSRGYIVPIGGAEEKLRDPSILQRFVDICGGRKARIAIIPTASGHPETGPGYERIFHDLGVGAARALPFEIGTIALITARWGLEGKASGSS